MFVPVNVERLKWYLNRARIMPLPEYGLRAVRAGAQMMERRRLAAGWVPGLNVRLLRTRPFFSAEAASGSRLEMSPGDQVALAQLLNGQVSFFGQDFVLGQPVNWHRDPATGITAPLTFGKTINYRDERVCGDIKVLWEISRHQHLVPLAVAFAVTGEKRYRDAVMEQIDSWVAQNPYGMGVHWCSSLEVALRVISWTMVHSLIAVRDGETGMLGCSRDRSALERSLHQHGYFIHHLLSRYSSANNHLIGELVGLYTLATVFDFGPDSAHWKEQARVELEEETVRQVFPDGVSREQAVHYHLEVLEYLLFVWCVSAAAGTPLSDKVLESIRKMAHFIRVLQPCRDRPPRIGDSDEATINRLTPADPDDPYEDILAAVQAVLNPMEPPRTEKAFWYQSIGGKKAGQSQEEDSTPNEISNFSAAGYSVIRTKRLHLVFDAGPLGYPAMAAHGHADALSFCFGINGRWWLVDPGTYTYHREHEARDYFRGTRAHNTLTVNGQDQSQIGGPFMWVKRANANLFPARDNGRMIEVAGEHDGYRQLGVNHHREIKLERDKDALEIVDRIRLETGRNAHLELNFHFAPEVSLTLDGNQAQAVRSDSNESINMVLDDGWEWQLYQASDVPMAGWYSPKLGIKVPAWTLRGNMLARESQTVTTRLMTSADG